MGLILGQYLPVAQLSEKMSFQWLQGMSTNHPHPLPQVFSFFKIILRIYL